MNFSSIEQTQTEQGTIITVRNPKDCKTFYWLKNQKVIIDGTQYVVIATSYIRGTFYEIGVVYSFSTTA